MTSRDKLRAATIGKKPEFFSRKVQHDGHTFEIRQPSIRARKELRTRCTSIDEEGVKFDMFEFLVWAVIKNTYVPGTNELVFEDADYDTMLENPTGGFMDSFSEVAAEIVNVEISSRKKPSKQTESDS